MKKSGFHRMVGVLALVVLAMPALQGTAAPKRDAVVGMWRVSVDFEGQAIPSIVSLSRDKEGQLSGQWISLWGFSPLEDLEHEGKTLRFKWVSHFGENDSTLSFAGTVARGALSGTLSHERGESKVEGKRVRPVPRPAGQWDVKVKVGDQEYPATLVIKREAKNKLAAEWQSQWGEHQITDVEFKNPELTFRRKSKVQDRQWESTFKGKIKGHTLAGTFAGERGDVSLEAERLGGALVGTWDLKVTSDSGNRRQILKVYPDLSATFGPIALDKVELEGDRVNFKTVLEFGDEKYDIAFAGTLDGRKLSGELTSPRGSRHVEGVKRGARQAKRLRKPDVVFVPTPPEVVDKMLELAQVTKDDLVYDLGCGDGRIVVAAAKKFGCRAVGYDISPQRVRESRQNVEKNGVGHLVTIEQEDIFTLDLSGANVITLYLLPSLNVKLIPQLEKLKPGSRIVSHDFAMRGVKPDKVVTITTENEYDEHTVYLWTTPLNKTDE